jgi:hypothetical protein
VVVGKRWGNGGKHERARVEDEQASLFVVAAF